jgi:hypothetical protein
MRKPPGLEGPPSTDPFDALRAAANPSPSLASRVDEALKTAELAAIDTAPLTPHARQAIDAAYESGRTVAIVSNNSTASILRPTGFGVRSRTNTSLPCRRDDETLVAEHSKRLLDRAPGETIAMIQ